MREDKEYYTFISYIRKDKKKAKRLQHASEYYCLPNHLSQENLDLQQEDRDKMVNDLLAMYSDPKAIMAYANDAVFKGEFWNNISYQTERVTAAFKDGAVDVDKFMDTPMKELTKLKEENLRIAADSSSQIKLKGQKYYVGEGKQRYLWLATRMGMPTVKDAPGIEIIQTYNLLTHDQIVGMVMKSLL